jgi:glycerol-3-phosphate acyltransferase PlsX
LRIGVDLLGGDCPPAVLLEGAVLALEKLDPSLILVLFATRDVIALLQETIHPRHAARVEWHATSESIRMDDEPTIAVRHKKESSLVKGIRLLKRRKINAFVSTGNTGALITASALILTKLPEIKRPALLTTLPAEKGDVAIVDVGGNVSCKAHHLVQFAKMGAAYQSIIRGIVSPRIGLLNIGSESKKGKSEICLVYRHLQGDAEVASKMTFIGNIEGKEIFAGKIDVLVTDGFTGNVLLKTAEGVASFLFHRLSELFQHHAIAKDLHRFSKQFHHAEYPGAIVIGVQGVVIKCHGAATPQAIFNGIKGAMNYVEMDLIGKLRNHLKP